MTSSSEGHSGAQDRQGQPDRPVREPHDAGAPPTGEPVYGGYYPGVIGDIVRTHAFYYHEYWGFDRTFETQQAAELAAFVSRFREEQDLLLVAHVGDRFAGSVAVDGSDALGQGARLRWLLIVPGFQGRGIGRGLLERAVTFCREKHYRLVYLWTFRGLFRARALYEKAGFKVVLERDVEEWGKTITEQKMELRF